MVVRDVAGVRRFAFSYNRGGFGSQSLVSAIGFDPDDSDLVIAGTVDNGLFFSMDNASTWRRIPGSEHIVNPLAFYWRSANSVLVASHGRGLFEVRMRFTLPPSSLGLICHGCRILPLGPPLFGAAVRPSQGSPNPQPVSAIQQSSFDEAVLVLDGRISGADVVQGRLNNIWATVGSSYLTFGVANSSAKFTVQERSGFAGFKGLPEADQLRSQGEVVKGLVLSNGNVVGVIYGTSETQTPAPVDPGRVESPNETDPSPTDPGVTDPCLRLIQTRVPGAATVREDAPSRMARSLDEVARRRDS